MNAQPIIPWIGGKRRLADLHIETVDIEYSLGNRHGSGAQRGELVITNYDPHEGLGGLF